MLDRHDAALLKLQRAHKHVSDLQHIIGGLPSAYVSTIERDEKAGVQTIKYYLPKGNAVAGDMATIIGDAVHNLRTAIEYAYLGAVERLAPSVLDSRTKFPVYPTREDVEAALKGRKIDALCPALFERVLNDIKPYEIGGNGLIKYLHDLDVDDKHWLLAPVFSVSWLSQIVIEGEKGIVPDGTTLPASGEGPFFFDFPLTVKIKDEGRVSVQVIFGSGTPLKNCAVLESLRDFSKIATTVIESLGQV